MLLMKTIECVPWIFQDRRYKEEKDRMKIVSNLVRKATIIKNGTTLTYSTHTYISLERK